MNRKIKFRGISIITNDWVYGYLVIMQQNKKHYIYQGSINDLQPYEVRPETVGQFTGLTDKNGVEIYEGDILRVDTTNSDMVTKMGFEAIKGIMKVIYSVSLCGFTLDSVGMKDAYGLFNNPEDYEVIGNIHQNLELLEK